jgi:hypothetical protein
MLQQHLGVFRTCTNIYDSPYLIWLLVVNSRVPLTEPSTAIFEFQTGFQVNILNHDSQTFNKRYAHWIQSEYLLVFPEDGRATDFRHTSM